MEQLRLSEALGGLPQGMHLAGDKAWASIQAFVSRLTAFFHYLHVSHSSVSFSPTSTEPFTEIIIQYVWAHKHAFLCQVFQM